MQSLQSVAFYHSNGLVPAWNLANRFAGTSGRIATLPDIIQTRRNTQPGATPWETYFTTRSAEFFGISRGGTRIIIVTHETGPLAQLEQILGAYAYQYKDTNRNKRGGRIPQSQFLELESGKYGEISIVDFDSYLNRYYYPFLEYLTETQALEDPLVKARLGSNAEEYVQRHAQIARQWHEQEGHGYVSDPYILQMGYDLNCAYEHVQLEDNAVAHLLAIGQLSNMCHEGQRSLISDVSCHGWSDGVRFVGVRAGTDLTDIRKVDTCRLLHRHWQQLLRPVSEPVERRFFVLIEMSEGLWFTQYEKMGECMDTCEPEFAIASLEPVGDPIEFTTTIGGYHGFFKYGINEIQAIAPPGANAYVLGGDVKIIGSHTHHRVPVQFYKATVDTSRRLTRQEELENDYDTTLSLLAQ